MTRYLLLHRPEAVTTDHLERDVEPIAAALGVDVYTARMRLVGTGVQALAWDADRGALEAAAGRLAEHGVRTVVYDPVSERRARPIRVRGVRRDGAALCLTGLEGEGVGRLGPDDRVLVVAVAVRQPDALLRGTPDPESLGPRSRFDLLTERGDWFSVRPAGFNYNTLGPHRGPSTAANLKALLDLVAETVDEVRYHLGCPANYGRPMDARDLAVYPRRAWAAWRGGLLEGPDPAVDHDAATRLAAVGAGPLNDPNVLTAVPLRRRALTWRGRVGRFSSPTYFWAGAWLLMALLGFLGRRPPDWMGALPASALAGGLLLGAAAASVAYGVRQLQRWQRVADTPTARVRSVAMGPAELKGTVDADLPLEAPYSKTLCAWYQFRLERWVVDPSSARSLGGSALRFLLTRSTPTYAERGGWRLVHEGDSADLPFWLRDETGRIRVEPAGAELHVRGEQTFEVQSHGVRYRATERVLPLGASLYVLGTVDRDEHRDERDRMVVEAVRRLKSDPHAMARYDIDGDGRVDADEWELARQAVRTEVEARLAERTREDTVFIGRGGPEEPFILSDHDEVDLARRLRWFARAGLAIGVAAGAYGALLLIGGG